MKYASLTQRILEGLIDFCILFVILFVVGGWLSFTLLEQSINPQMAPFIIMELILFPIGVLLKILTNPTAYGDAYVYYLLSVIFFTIETMFYIIIEISSLKGHLGHHLTKTIIKKSDGNTVDLLSMSIRCFFKTIVRYLLAVPLLLILMTNKKQSLHDILSKTVVISRRSDVTCKRFL